MRKKKNKRKGFTLIELLVVIALIVVIGFFSWQELSHFGRTRELSDTVSSIAALLRDARQRSIIQANGRSWGVRFENGSRTPSGRGRFFLFSTDQPPGGTLADWATSTLITLDPALEFSQPIDFSVIIFQQLSGELASPNCPGNTEEVAVRAAGGGESALIAVFCNGRIEY